MQKIVVVGRPIEDSFEWHINQTLNKMGYSSVLLDCFFGVGKIREAMRMLNHMDYLPKQHWNLIFNRILGELPQLIIVCYRDFHPILVRKIKDAGVRIVHINPDTITTLNRQAVFAEPYDYYFVKSNYMKNFMQRKLSLNTFKYYEAFNASHLVSKYNNKLEAEQHENIQVLMYGSYYPSKSLMVQELANQGVNFASFGAKGDYFSEKKVKNYQKEYLVGKGKADKIFGSKLVFNNLTFGEIDSLNCRFFEVLGAGGVQVVDLKDDLVTLYKKEYLKYISFESIKEVKGKLDVLLKDDDLRFELSAYNKHISAEYTYEKMLSRIISVINY